MRNEEAFQRAAQITGEARIQALNDLMASGGWAILQASCLMWADRLANDVVSTDLTETTWKAQAEKQQEAKMVMMVLKHPQYLIDMQKQTNVIQLNAKEKENA